jgi:hypothetical protein
MPIRRARTKVGSATVTCRRIGDGCGRLAPDASARSAVPRSDRAVAPCSAAAPHISRIVECRRLTLANQGARGHPRRIGNRRATEPAISDTRGRRSGTRVMGQVAALRIARVCADPPTGNSPIAEFNSGGRLARSIAWRLRGGRRVRRRCTPRARVAMLVACPSPGRALRASSRAAPQCAPDR